MRFNAVPFPTPLGPEITNKIPCCLFNVLYLLDVLGNLKNSEVRFSFSSSQGATLLTMPESNQFCYVLMPMRI